MFAVQPYSKLGAWEQLEVSKVIIRGLPSVLASLCSSRIVLALVTDHLTSTD